MEKEQNFAEWDECYMLGISVIDKQHENLVRILNKLHLACVKNSESINDRFISATHEAVDYIQYHFSTEEKLMNLVEFPECQKHRVEHEAFIREILIHSQQLYDRESYIPNQLVCFFGEWLLAHIKVSDREFADFFMNMNHYSKLKLSLTKGQQMSEYPVEGNSLTRSFYE